MQNQNINRVKKTLLTSTDRTKRTYALWILLTYHTKSLTSSELFSLISIMFEVGFSNPKYPGIRYKLENEIKARQDQDTIFRLLELLNSDNSLIREFSAMLLNDFCSTMIIEPVLIYLQNTNDHILVKRSAICALQKYNDVRIKEYLINEYESNQENQDNFYRSNYLETIERILKSMN